MKKKDVKIIISGLDGAGKTSILTALDQKYDFHKEIMELKPTIRVEYHQTTFLGTTCYFWDMGGQEKYRAIYERRKEIYFGDTDLFVFVIDIQETARFEEALEYLEMVLSYFIEDQIDVPLIIAFHKFDPERRGSDQLINHINELSEIVLDKYPHIKTLFQQTSIYDIISIVQLISYGLSIFDEKFFDLSELLENYLDEFKCLSLILFDKNGIIISEFYNDQIVPKTYVGLLESLKEHLFLLKRMQEEDVETTYDFFSMEENLLSYLHKIKVGTESLFISVLMEKENKENFMELFSDFKTDLEKILLELKG